MCQSLSSAGHQVTLIVADGQGDEDGDTSVVDVGKAGRRLSRMLITTRRIEIAALAIDADVYHFHDPELIPIGLDLKRRGKKVIFDAHEDLAKQLISKPYLNAPLLRLLSRLYSRYEATRVRKFDAIATATPFICEKYKKLNKNVIDINNFPLINELCSPPAFRPKESAVCYVGGICRIRGIVELTKALALTSSSAKLHLAGKFSDSEQMVRSLPGWEMVKEWGHIDRLGVRDVMSRSIAGIVTFHPVPNHVDAQPNKMFEYMSAGIPIIASAFPLWREIVEGNRCGICVNPLNPMAIARAIDTLVLNPVLAQELGANGRRAVVDRYNWTAEEKKLLGLYNSLESAAPR